jgi:uncharacterized protein YndB with AHSA1/START domain
MNETTFDTPTERELVTTRSFDAPRDLVWAAWTSPEHVPHWLLGPDGWSMPVCEIDLRPGGAWHYEWRNDADGTQFGMHGEFREVEAPERLVATEVWEDNPPAVNTLVLTEQNGRTTVTQTSLFPSQEARDAAIATGMNDGVAKSYDRLDGHLRTMAG